MDYVSSIEQTTDGGYIVAGTTSSTAFDVSGNNGFDDYWILKLDNLGVIQWKECFGGMFLEAASAIQQTLDGGYIIAGYSSSNNGDVTGNHGNFDYWIVKLSNSGGIQWQKSLGGNDEDVANSIQQTTDGGYIVAGYSLSNNGDVSGNNGLSDYWIVKLDNTGTVQWQKSLGGSDEESAKSIQETNDGGYIIVGESKSTNNNVTNNHGLKDYWVVKLNNLGSIQWQKCLGGSADDYATAIKQTTDGGYIISGNSESIDGDITGNHGSTDYWIVKLDNSGAIQWQKSLGGSDNDYASAILQTTDGGYIVSGYSYFSSNGGDVTGHHGAFDFWVVKLDNLGNIQWQKCLGGTSDEFANSIQQTTDGGYVVAGYSNSDNSGDVIGNTKNEDYWIVKLSGTSVGITENINENVLSVYPNPTNGTFTLLATIEGVYTITNELGQTIQEVKLNNTNNYTVNITNLNAGIYFIVGYNNKQVTRQKIVVTK